VGTFLLDIIVIPVISSVEQYFYSSGTFSWEEAATSDKKYAQV